MTVAIVALPLSMAIAIASGASPVQGLYTAIVAGFLISALGGSRFMNIIDAVNRRLTTDDIIAMNRAVEGCRATMSNTFMPSSMPPPAGMMTPSTVFSPRSCMRGLNWNSPLGLIVT